MDRVKLVDLLGRYHLSMVHRLFSLLTMLCILLVLTTCGSSRTSSPITPSDGNPQTPSLAELSDMLMAELERLGKDPSKVTAAAPSGSDNAVFDLSATIVEGSGIDLTWTERIIGDYDQNGEVNLSDLAPLAINWGTNVAYDDPSLHGGFGAWPDGDPDGAGALNWRKARIDGDSNGEISGSDITPIAIHFKEVNDGYQIERAINYGTGTLDWEALPIDIGFGIQPSAPRDDAAIYSNDAPVRYVATIHIALPEFAHYFRVKPYDEISDTTGEISNVVAYLPSTTEDTVPPYWLDTVGVAKLTPSDESITVEFGTATDDTSLPVSYRVYWAEGDEANPDAPFDYGAAQNMDVASSPYTITGLTNDQYYRVAVRAMDSAPAPNIEANTVLLGRKAGATDIYPPEWQGETGIRELFFGNGLVYLVFDAAFDSHTDSFGTWESGPVIYRVYHGPGEVPDFSTASTQDFVDLGLESYVVEIEGIDTTAPHWFSVRAFDQADPPNEDLNQQFKSSLGIKFSTLDYPDRGPGIPPGLLQGSFGYIMASPSRNHSGLLMHYLFEEDRNEAYKSYYSYLNGEFIHKHDFQVGDHSSEVSVLTENGNLILLTTTRPTPTYLGFPMLNIFDFESGVEEQIDFSPLGINRLGITTDNKIWLFTEEIIQIWPVHMKQFFTVQPFHESMQISETLPEDEHFQNWILDGYQEVYFKNGDISLFLRKDIRTGDEEKVLLDYSNSVPTINTFTPNPPEGFRLLSRTEVDPENWTVGNSIIAVIWM